MTSKNIDASNLAKIIDEMDHFLYQHPALSADEKNQFFQLENTIKTILVAQKGWLKNGGGYLSDFWLKKGNIEDNMIPAFDQEMLKAEMKKTHLNILNFTNIILKKVLADIREIDGKLYSLAIKYPALFRNILESIESIQEYILNNRVNMINEKSRQPELQLNQNEKIYLQGNSNPHMLANFLQARFVPFSQAIDPTEGKNKVDGKLKSSEGTCYGHTQSWKDEILLFGRYTRLQAHDYKAYYYQYRQLNIRFFETQQVSQYSKNIYDLRDSIDHILERINAQSIYEISIHVNSKKIFHSVGIRKVPIANPHGTSEYEIEFFDSNLGLFVFPNERLFKIWFIDLLHSCYHANDPSLISLIEMAKQPATAKTSIPPIRINETNVQNYYKNKSSLAKSDDDFIYQQNSISHISANNLINEKIDIELDKKTKERLLPYLVKVEKNTKMDLSTFYGDHQENIEQQDTELIDQSLLKNKINFAIDQEIDRLQKNIIGDSQPKIDALFNLKKQIAKSPPHLPLAIIIDHWLIAKQGDKTHREVLDEHRIFPVHSHTRAFNFIQTLTCQYEVSPMSVMNLQMKLIKTLTTLINQNCEHLLPHGSHGTVDHHQNKTTKNFAIMQQSILKYVKGGLTLNQVVEEIAKTCKAISTGFFARQVHWRSNEIDSIYAVLKKLDPHNPSSLIHVERKLQKKIDKYFPRSTSAIKQHGTGIG